jgi:hypothetical protein
MRGTLARLFPLLAVAWALCFSACGRDRLPEVIPARASAERAVVVIVDGLTPALLEAYLSSAASRASDRALAGWLLPGPPDGGAQRYATGQVHTALLPLPALPDPSAAALLTGRTPAALDARDPGDTFAADAVHLGTLVPRAVVVGLLGTPGLESNDADRVTLARASSEKFGSDGARLMVVRLSGLFDALTTRGLSQAPAALARLDAELARLLAPPFAPDDTVLVLTAGAAAGPSPSQSPLNPGDIARALGVAPEAVVPTGGLLRVRGLAAEKVRFLGELAPSREVLLRTAAGLEIWDAELGRTRALLPDELTHDDARRRLADWLAVGEWVAVADRLGGHEFRRVGEDPVRVALGGLGEAESLVPVVFAGAVPPGAPQRIAYTDIAPALLTLLGRETPLPGASTIADDGLATLVGATRRPRSENRVDQGHVVLERTVGAGLATALTAQALPLRRRTLGEGAPLSDAGLAATLAEARAVIGVDPLRVTVETALFAAWGGPAMVTLDLEGLTDEVAAARVATAVRLGEGLRALRGGLHPRATTLLADVDGLPPESAPWLSAFRYWAERAAARVQNRAEMPPAPSLGAVADGPYLAGLLAAFELQVPGPEDTPAARDARIARLPAVAGLTGRRARLAADLRTLFTPPRDTPCVPADAVARRTALLAAVDGFLAAGEAGLAAQAILEALRTSPSGPGRLSPGESVRLHERLAATLSLPGAGHARLATARGALGLRLVAAVSEPDGSPPALEPALQALTRLALLKLQQEIVDDREPGSADRNAARAASLLDGTGAREPGLLEGTVQLAIDADANVQSRLVAAVLASGLNVGALLGGHAAEQLVRLQRMLDLAARPLPGAAGATPEARVVSAIADALAFAVGTLTGRPAPPPFAARDQLAALDLPALRTQALAARDAAGQDDAPLPLLAYGPFVHLVVELELAFAAAAASEGPQAAVPHLQAAVDVAARLARSEAGRAGVEAGLGPRIDGLATALKAAVPLIVTPSDTAALQAALLAIDLTPPAPGEGLAGQLVAATALLARDAGYALDLARRGTAADARLVAGGAALTRSLVDAAVAAGTSRVARDAALLLHGAHAALADAPRYWPDLSATTILARSPGARAALGDVARGLRGGLDDAGLRAALRKDDLGVFVRDLLAFAAANVDALVGLAGEGPPARAAALRSRFAAHLDDRLNALAGAGPGEGPRVHSLLLWGAATIAAAEGRVDRVDALSLAATKHLTDIGEAHNAWLFALEAHFARLEAGRFDPAVLARAAETCPGQAWQLAPAHAWSPAAATTGTGTGLDALATYVASARAGLLGGLELAVALRAAEGHDVYDFRLGQSLPALLLGKRSGTFNLGLGAQANARDEVTLTWGANPVGNPRDAALRAWLLAAWNALEADDDVALDAALGRLVTTLDGADPAVFGGAADETLPALSPGRPTTVEPLMMAWVLTVAGARGHFALTDHLWSRWVAAVQAGGPDEGTSGTDFGTVSICETAQGASSYGCTAPRHVELRLRDAGAVRSLARWVATEVEARLSRATGQTPPVGAGAAAFSSARKAAPRLLPAWTETLAEAREGTRGARKTAPLPRLAEATFIATHHKMAPAEAFARIHAAGGVCEAALRTAIADLPAVEPGAVAARCGAGPLAVIALIGQPTGAPQEMVARAGLALGALRWLGASQGEAWAAGVVAQVERILFHPEPELRAATLAQVRALVDAARAARRPSLAITLRTFALASAVVDGRTPGESAAAILSDARGAGVSGVPATVLLRHLVFDTGSDADHRALAGAFLSAPVAAPAGGAGEPGGRP